MRSEREITELFCAYGLLLSIYKKEEGMDEGSAAMRRIMDVLAWVLGEKSSVFNDLSKSVLKDTKEFLGEDNLKMVVNDFIAMRDKEDILRN